MYHAGGGLSSLVSCASVPFRSPVLRCCFRKVREAKASVFCCWMLTCVSTDLKFRAQSCGAVAFVGDAEASSRFEEIARDVGVSSIFQVRTDEDQGLGKGRVDFQRIVEAVKQGSKWHGEPQSKTDLALLCASQPGAVVLWILTFHLQTLRRVQLETPKWCC